MLPDSAPGFDALREEFLQRYDQALAVHPSPLGGCRYCSIWALDERQACPGAW